MKVELTRNYSVHNHIDAGGYCRVDVKLLDRLFVIEVSGIGGGFKTSIPVEKMPDFTTPIKFMQGCNKTSLAFLAPNVKEAVQILVFEITRQCHFDTIALRRISK